MAAEAEGRRKREKRPPQGTQLKREREVAEDAEQQGFTLSYSERKGYAVAEAPRPSATRLLKDMHGPHGEIAYKILSAATHGTTYGVMQGMEPEPSERGTTGQILRPDNKLGLLAFAVPYAGMAYIDAYSTEVELMGWHLPEWASFRLHALKKFRYLLRVAGA